MKADAVILNPCSNSGNGAARWKRLLETDLARERGLREAAVFDGSQGLEALHGWVSERLRGGAVNFVAAGGDGTLNLALNVLLNSPARVPGLRLGAVGLGSSNDFQKPHAEKGRSVAAGLHCRLAFENAAAQDIGCLQTIETSRFFALNASVGVTAEANWNFNEARGALGLLKRKWVDGAIIATALKTFQSYSNFQVSIAIDGAPARQVALTNLGVVKSVHFSGQMRYDIPQPKDDGHFGVHLCEGMGKLEMIAVLQALNAGKFQGRPKTASTRARRVEISAERAFAIETDGEVIRAQRALFTLLPRELAVCP